MPYSSPLRRRRATLALFAALAVNLPAPAGARKRADIRSVGVEIR